jgi:hypothetical protein
MKYSIFRKALRIKTLIGLDVSVASYGQRFRAVRLGPGWKPGRRARLTQEDVADGHFERAAVVSNLEHPQAKLPKPVTIREHAAALKAEPWELLLGVPTEYDRLRFPDLSDVQLEALLAGLKVMPEDQLKAVLKTCTKAVAALPDPLIQEEMRLGRKSTPASAAKAGRTDRGKKSA